MKITFAKYILPFAICAAFVACSSNGEVRDLGVNAVEKLYSPADQKAVVLQSSSSETIYFEWEPSIAEDGGAVLYEVIFDKEDGDFSDPIAIVTADNNGVESHATITHKALNQIAASAGIESAAQGTIKWTVWASKGINPVKAKEERSIIVTRLAGFAEIQDNLYITGKATEVGGDIPNAGSFIPKREANVNWSLNLSQKRIELEYQGLEVWAISNYTAEGLTGSDNSDDSYKFRMECSDGETEWRAKNSTYSKPSGNESYYYMTEKTNVEQWTNGEVWKSPGTDGWSGHAYCLFFV